MRRKTDLEIIIEWIVFFFGVFLAMIAVGTFAGPFMALLYIAGLPIFLAQILALFLSGGFCWMLIEWFVMDQRGQK